MTVAELIAKLEKVPKDIEVTILVEGDEKVYLSVWA